MGYKNENLKHALGIGQKPKYNCPQCKKPLSIIKPVFMVVCANCDATIYKEELI